MESVTRRAGFLIFARAPAPAIAAALEASLEVIANEPERRERLLARARHLRERLRLAGDSPIIPIIIGENERAVAVARELQAAGLDGRAIRPPTGRGGAARLRVTAKPRLSGDARARSAE